MPLFGPPDVAKLESKRDVGGLIKALGYEKDRFIRKAAASALGAIGDTRAVGPLIAVLGGPNTVVGAAAATALGAIGDTRAVGPLIAVLSGWDADLRRAAVGALGAIGVGAVTPLVAVLGAGDKKAREAAAGALGQIGGPAVQPLLAALRDESVGWHATEALGQIGSPAVQPLVEALEVPDARVRRAAAYVLGVIGDPGAVDPLIAALGDQGDAVRRAAAEALGVMGDGRAIQALIGALTDVHGDVGWAASAALDRLAWHPDRGAAGAAYWAARCEWGRCVEIGAPAVGPLVALLASRYRGTRKDAAGALHRLAWAPGRDEAAAAYWAIEGQWGKCVEIGAPAVGPLVDALTDRDRLVRKAAAEGLVTLYRSGLLDATQKAQLLAQRDSITRSHDDQDRSGVITCKGIDFPTGGHTDEGIGVEFPI